MVATRCVQGQDLIIGVTPFELPNARLAAALGRTDALGVLDLGRHAARARAELTQINLWAKKPWGVRVPTGCAIGPHEIPAGATTILLPFGSGVAIEAKQPYIRETLDPFEKAGFFAYNLHNNYLWVVENKIKPATRMSFEELYAKKYMVDVLLSRREIPFERLN